MVLSILKNALNSIKKPAIDTRFTPSSLINKTVMVKLVSGEQLVAVVAERQPHTSYILKDVLMVQKIFDSANQISGTILIQFSDLIEVQASIEISDWHIITIAPVAPTVEQIYRNTISNFIAIVNSKKQSTAMPLSNSVLSNSSSFAIDGLEQYLEDKPLEHFAPFTKKVQ